MKDQVLQLLAWAGLENSVSAYIALVLSLVLFISLVVHVVLHKVVFRLLLRNHDGGLSEWQTAFKQFKLFKRLASTLQGIILYTQARIWIDSDEWVYPLIAVLTLEWVLLYGLLSLYSLINTIELLLHGSRVSQQLPVRGLSQGTKLVSAIIAIIIGLSLIIGKSPVILFSGLGAMTAVLLLVFRDPLLGLVAGVQLSANNMLKVGDWLEMDKYGADGDVVDINLTTVKIRNFDNTITTIPSYALIADSFKNWRGMSEAGGRRIKRAFNIDVTSVHFLGEEELAQLRRLSLLSGYLDSKLKEIEAEPQRNNSDAEVLGNGRRLTNLGTLRAYLTAYLKANANIHPGMTTMVRQLESGANGLPLEVYCFSKSVVWVEYENIQADIFDHVFAIVPTFNLRFHQNPTGADMRNMGIEAATETNSGSVREGRL